MSNNLNLLYVHSLSSTAVYAFEYNILEYTLEYNILEYNIIRIYEYNILEYTLYICKESKVKIIFPICERQI